MKSIDFYQTFTGLVPASEEREKCAGCGQPRRVEIIRDMSTWDPNVRKARSEYPITGWRYLGYGHFCTQTCATRFANKIVDNL